MVCSYLTVLCSSLPGIVLRRKDHEAGDNLTIAQLKMFQVIVILERFR